jgi:hypothetical protein
MPLYHRLLETLTFAIDEKRHAASSSVLFSLDIIRRRLTDAPEFCDQ